MAKYKFKNNMSGHFYTENIFCPTQNEGYSTDGQTSSFSAYRLTGDTLEDIIITHHWLHQVEQDGSNGQVHCPNVNGEGFCSCDWDRHYDVDNYDIEVISEYDLLADHNDIPCEIRKRIEEV